VSSDFWPILRRDRAAYHPDMATPVTERGESMPRLGVWPRRPVMFVMLQPHLVQSTWRVRCYDGWSHGEIWSHPIGWEFRVYCDGALQRSQAYRDLAAAEQDAERTLAGLKDFNHARLGTATPPDNERAATTC
jgi:hypothetical protein